MIVTYRGPQRVSKMLLKVSIKNFIEDSIEGFPESSYEIPLDGSLADYSDGSSEGFS